MCCQNEMFFRSWNGVKLTSLLARGNLSRQKTTNGRDKNQGNYKVLRKKIGPHHRTELDVRFLLVLADHGHLARAAIHQAKIGTIVELKETNKSHNMLCQSIPLGYALQDCSRRPSKRTLFSLHSMQFSKCLENVVKHSICPPQLPWPSKGSESVSPVSQSCMPLLQ